MVVECYKDKVIATHPDVAPVNLQTKLIGAHSGKETSEMFAHLQFNNLLSSSSLLNGQ